MGVSRGPSAEKPEPYLGVNPMLIQCYNLPYLNTLDEPYFNILR